MAYEQHRQAMVRYQTQLEVAEDRMKEVINERDRKISEVNEEAERKLVILERMRDSARERCKDEQQFYRESCGEAHVEDCRSEQANLPNSKRRLRREGSDRMIGDDAGTVSSRNQRESQGHTTSPAPAPTSATETHVTSTVEASQYSLTRHPIPWEIIHRTRYPTILWSPEHECWVELRCFSCGANTKTKSKVLLSGIFGFTSHVTQLHRDELAGAMSDRKAIVEKCIFHKLSNEEAIAIRIRGSTEYQVPRVTRPAEERRPRALEDEDPDYEEGESSPELPESVVTQVAQPSRDERVTSKRMNDVAAPPAPPRRMFARKSAPSLPLKRTFDVFREDTEELYGASVSPRL